MSNFEDDPRAEEIDKYGKYHPKYSGETTVFTVSHIDEMIDYSSSLGFKQTYHKKNQRKRNIVQVERRKK